VKTRCSTWTKVIQHGLYRNKDTADVFDLYMFEYVASVAEETTSVKLAFVKNIRSDLGHSKGSPLN